MKPVRLHEKARFEIKAILEEAEEAYRVSPFDFYRDFDLVTLNIEENPGLYQRIEAIDAFEYRKAKFRKLPFVLVYRVDDDSVLVTAVHHEARNASHWHDRIPK